MADMLPSLITVNKKRDSPAGGRPLNARSLALSALLGTRPPALPASSLVALAELFGINGGTMRTALSRMVAAGDVTLSAGWYTLSDRLRQRQAAQDVGRTPTGDGWNGEWHTAAGAAGDRWDGDWHTAVALADQRELPDRRQVRVVMTNARFAELRPTVWMRPANLPAPALDDGWVVTTGPVSGADDGVVTRRLWDVKVIAEEALRLEHELELAESRIDRSDPSEIPGAFTLSATVVRFLRSEPLLPAELAPAGWPLPDLRRRYARFEADLQAMMRPILHPEPSATA